MSELQIITWLRNMPSFVKSIDACIDSAAFIQFEKKLSDAYHINHHYVVWLADEHLISSWNLQPLLTAPSIYIITAWHNNTLVSEI